MNYSVREDVRRRQPRTPDSAPFHPLTGSNKCSPNPGPLRFSPRRVASGREGKAGQGTRSIPFPR